MKPKKLGKDFRRKGMAYALLREAEKIARKRKLKWMKARVYTFNKSAQGVLKKSDYRPIYSEYFKILT